MPISLPSKKHMNVDEPFSNFNKGKKTIQAVGLLSGGLDSTLAAKIMLEQGISVFAVNFVSPFCTCTPKNAGCAAVNTAVEELGAVPLKRIALKDDYLEMVRNPRHGRGSGMNPCIDCRLMKIRHAGRYMEEIGASFLFTGEVLGQRPMSQHRQAIETIDRESGLRGYILRPLSALQLEPTVPEERKWVRRDALLGISGRSRKTQMSLADRKGIADYPCPAGGCLLTDVHFSRKLKDYFSHTETPSMKDIPLLKVGRHVRLNGSNKVIVARNEKECGRLSTLSGENDHLFIPRKFSGPTVILQGDAREYAVATLLRYTKKSIPRNAEIIHVHRGGEECLPLDTFDVNDH
jgi:tRNA U34 2-thiouridine synthase MnmA/TrmU